VEAVSFSNAGLTPVFIAQLRDVWFGGRLASAAPITLRMIVFYHRDTP
jgi:hypothetical protein